MNECTRMFLFVIISVLNLQKNKCNLKIPFVLIRIIVAIKNYPFVLIRVFVATTNSHLC